MDNIMSIIRLSKPVSDTAEYQRCADALKRRVPIAIVPGNEILVRVIIDSSLDIGVQKGLTAAQVVAIASAMAQQGGDVHFDPHEFEGIIPEPLASKTAKSITFGPVVGLDDEPPKIYQPRGVITSAPELDDWVVITE